MKTAPLLLLASLIISSPPAAQTEERYRGPIIDMHVHSYTTEDYWGTIPNLVTGQMSPGSAEEHMRQHNVAGIAT